MFPLSSIYCTCKLAPNILIEQNTWDLCLPGVLLFSLFVSRAAKLCYKQKPFLKTRSQYDKLHQLQLETTLQQQTVINEISTFWKIMLRRFSEQT